MDQRRLHRVAHRSAIDLRGAQFTDVYLGYADLRGLRLDGARFTLRNLA